MILENEDINRIIEMAWEDRTPFEAIKFQFGIPEKEVIKLMRGNLKQSSFKRWRKRVNSGVSTKHLKKRSQDIHPTTSVFDLCLHMLKNSHDH